MVGAARLQQPPRADRITARPDKSLGHDLPAVQGPPQLYLYRLAICTAVWFGDRADQCRARPVRREPLLSQQRLAAHDPLALQSASPLGMAIDEGLMEPAMSHDAVLA